MQRLRDMVIFHAHTQTDGDSHLGISDVSSETIHLLLRFFLS